jgi:shikimate dehydrogenase
MSMTTAWGGPGPDIDLEHAPPQAVVMDMVYKPLETSLLRQARARGLRTADGLEMLIGQAIPSFAAFYGRDPPTTVDIRGLVLASLAEPAETD